MSADKAQKIELENSFMTAFKLSAGMAAFTAIAAVFIYILFKMFISRQGFDTPKGIVDKLASIAMEKAEKDKKKKEELPGYLSINPYTASGRTGMSSVAPKM